jgi:hypothetical protein
LMNRHSDYRYKKLRDDVGPDHPHFLQVLIIEP